MVKISRTQKAPPLKKMIIWSSREVKLSTFHHTVKKIKRPATGKEKMFAEHTAESVFVL